MKAIWNGKIIAESNSTISLEGNIYFPPDSVKIEYLEKSKTHTKCPWKGLAHYYNIVVDSKVNEDAAWTYPQPSDAAKQIKNFIAFWRGIKIEK